MAQDQHTNLGQTKRIIALIIISIFISIGGILAYSEFLKWKAEQEKQKIIEAARKPIISSLKDPLSAQFKDEWITSDKITVCGEVNAKNSLGGYVGFKYYISNGDEFLIEGSTFSSWPLSKIKGDIPEEIKIGIKTMERASEPDAKSYTINSANSMRKPLFDLLYLKLCTND